MDQNVFMKCIHECEYISIVFEYKCEYLFKKNHECECEYEYSNMCIRMHSNANTEYEYPMPEYRHGDFQADSLVSPLHWHLLFLYATGVTTFDI